MRSNTFKSITRLALLVAVVSFAGGCDFDSSSADDLGLDVPPGELPPEGPPNIEEQEAALNCQVPRDLVGEPELLIDAGGPRVRIVSWTEKNGSTDRFVGFSYQLVSSPSLIAYALDTSNGFESGVLRDATGIVVTRDIDGGNAITIDSIDFCAELGPPLASDQDGSDDP